jgi:hypothetical protein
MSASGDAAKIGATASKQINRFMKRVYIALLSASSFREARAKPGEAAFVRPEPGRDATPRPRASLAHARLNVVRQLDDGSIETRRVRQHVLIPLGASPISGMCAVSSRAHAAGALPA